MNYLIARDTVDGYERLYESKVKVSKGDFVTVPNYDDVPITAEVIQLVDQYTALTSSTKSQPIIDVVNIKEWKANRMKELDNRILVDKMQSKIAEVKMLEQFEKYAGKDSEMLQLLNQFKSEVPSNVEEMKSAEEETEY